MFHLLFSFLLFPLYWTSSNGDSSGQLDGVILNSLHNGVDFHRNLISLNLFSHRLTHETTDLYETKLQLQLATKLWAPAAAINLTGGQLALFAQALEASCLDPTNFYGVNLLDTLARVQDEATSTSSYDKSLIALTLCLLSNDTKTLVDEGQKVNQQQNNLRGHRENNGPKESTNSQALRLITLSCFRKKQPQVVPKSYLHDLMARLLPTQSNDGSFDHNLISTGLVLQAVLASGVNLDFLWDKGAARGYINSQKAISSLEAFYLVPVYHKTWLELSCKNKQRDLDLVKSKSVGHTEYLIEGANSRPHPGWNQVGPKPVVNAADGDVNRNYFGISKSQTNPRSSGQEPKQVAFAASNHYLNEEKDINAAINILETEIYGDHIPGRYSGPDVGQHSTQMPVGSVERNRVEVEVPQQPPQAQVQSRPYPQIKGNMIREAIQPQDGTVRNQGTLFRSIYSWFKTEESLEPFKRETVPVTFTQWINQRGNGTDTVVNVTKGSTLFRGLSEVSKTDPRFSFEGTSHSQLGYYITAMNGVGENLEAKKHWLVYRMKGDITYTLRSSISEIILVEGDHFVFWYRVAK